MARSRRITATAWLGAVRTPLGAVTATLLVLVLALAALGPVIWGAQAVQIDTAAISQGPSAAHPLGTDTLGRDILARVLVATRLSVLMALAATALGVSVGLLIGSLPWLGGPRVGRITASVIGVAIAFPSLLLSLFLAVVFGVGALGAMFAVGLAMAPWFARVTSTLIAGVQGRDFVAAALVGGESRLLVLVRHLLPNVGDALVVNATVGAGGALLAFSGLSFLGLGAQAPVYDWGLLLSEGLNGIYVNPAGALAPGVAIVVAGLAFNLFGEATAKRIARRTDSPVGASRRHDAPAPDPSAEVDVDVVLDVDDLWVSIDTANGPVDAVRGVTLRVDRGEVVGIVGESGSGKSLTALAVARLLEAPVRDRAAVLRFLGTDVSRRTPAVDTLLGRSFGMTFQDPGTSLNPTMPVGRQLAEVSRTHFGATAASARDRAVERLRAVRVPSAERRARQYPHEFSGGMRQRAMIAMSIMGEPALLVADEATTALDVTVQRQVLQLLDDIRRSERVGMLFISHDIGVIEQVADRVLVMYAGRVVEEVRSDRLMTHARHRYTRALIAAVPQMSSPRDEELATIPGRPPSLDELPTACAFAPRCAFASERCRTEDPALVDTGDGGRVACWHPADLPEPGSAARGAAPASLVAEAGR